VLMSLTRISCENEGMEMKTAEIILITDRKCLVIANSLGFRSMNTEHVYS